MKKLLLMLLGVLMTFPMMARDFEYTYEGQTLTYTVISEDDKTCMTKEGSSTPGNQVEGDLIIPAVAIDENGNEYNVTEIGEYAFIFCSSLSSVSIPGSVTTIGGWAFMICSSLSSVVIPGSVTEIGVGAFYGCSSLSSVAIPGSVTTIGDSAFYGCSSLSSVAIPASVTTIDNSAFVGCSSLSSVTIPGSVTTIGAGAFYGCSSLTSVYYNAQEPIEAMRDVFNNYENTTLYVPAAAVEKCKLIDPWKNFSSIVAYDFTGINDVSADIDGDIPCEVYTVRGVKVGDSTDGLTPGIYIVRQGNDVKKIAVN